MCAAYHPLSRLHDSGQEALDCPQRGRMPLRWYSGSLADSNLSHLRFHAARIKQLLLLHERPRIETGSHLQLSIIPVLDRRAQQSIGDAVDQVDLLSVREMGLSDRERHRGRWFKVNFLG